MRVCAPTRVSFRVDLTAFNLAGLLVFKEHLRGKSSILGASRSTVGEENPYKNVGTCPGWAAQ